MKLVSVCTSIVLALAMVSPLVTGCAKTAQASGVEVGIATLASGGVIVQESYEGKAPIAPLTGTISAMRITRWQLRNMLAQADAGMGMTGAALDAFDRTRANPKLPGVATFIGAWVKRSQGPLATYAAQFMPKTADYAHPANLTFPLLVVTLFIADAARVSPTAARPVASTAFAWERVIAAPASAAVGCSTVTDFVSSVIANVTDALKLSGNGFFETLWNVAVVAVIGIGIRAVQAALAPLFAAITAVATVLAMVTTIASSLQAWTLNVQADPATLTLLGTAVDGKFTANLNADSIPWPDALKNCAKSLAGIDLDQITYVDAPVTWETMGGGIPDDAAIVDQQKKIGADKTALTTYRTKPLSDAQKPECSSLHLHDIIIGRATVERSDIQHLQAALTTASLSLLPNVVQQFITPLIKPWIDAQIHDFTNLLAAPVTAAATATLEKYERDDAKCVSPPPVMPATAAASAAPATPSANPMVGNWACLITKHVNVQGVSLDVNVHVGFTFGADGMAVARFPMATTGTFGPGGGTVQADKDMQAAPAAPYSYKDKGTGANDSGILHFPTAVSSSADEDITFSNPNTYYTLVTSKESGKEYLMKCKRT